MKSPLTVLALLLLPAGSAVSQVGWSSPNLLTALNTNDSDSGPHLSADGLTLHFSSFRLGNWEIFSTTRPVRTAPWGPVVHESALGTTSTEDQPFMTADGLEIYFSSLQAGGMGGFDVLKATRPTTLSPWGAPTFVTELNSSASESAVSVTADNLELYMLSTGFNAPASPNNAIFRCTRASTAMPWGNPTLVNELANLNTHRDATISPDGLTIVYTEYIPSPVARLRVLRATRTNRTAPFDPPQALDDFDTVGTSQGVFGVAPSGDGLEMIIAAGFPVGSGSQELLETFFDGLTQQGIAGRTSTMSLYLRDSARPGAIYALAIALGDTGFNFGPLFVPIDPDFLFFFTLGSNLPPFTGGFVGALGPSGVGIGTLSGPDGNLPGLHVFAAGFTFDAFGLAFVSNAVEIEFHP